MSFIDRVIEAAADRGAQGAKRVLTRLTAEAASGGHKCPKPADFIDRLPHNRKDEPEAEPMAFAYALYLMVEYGYDVNDATRLANKFKTELDGYMVEGNVLLTKTNLTKAEFDLKVDLRNSAVSRKTTSIAKGVGSLRDLLADGKGELSDDDKLVIANIVDDLRALTTTNSQVAELVS